MKSSVLEQIYGALTTKCGDGSGLKSLHFLFKISCDKGGMHRGKIWLLSSFHCLSSVQNSKPKSNQIMDHMWTVSLCFMATVYDKRTVTCKHQDKWRDWLICVTSGCVVKSNLARETLICSTLRWTQMQFEEVNQVPLSALHPIICTDTMLSASPYRFTQKRNTPSKFTQTLSCFIAHISWLSTRHMNNFLDTT